MNDSFTQLVFFVSDMSRRFAESTYHFPSGSVVNRDGALVDDDHPLVSSQIIDDRTFHTVIL